MKEPEHLTASVPLNGSTSRPEIWGPFLSTEPFYKGKTIAQIKAIGIPSFNATKADCLLGLQSWSVNMSGIDHD